MLVLTVSDGNTLYCRCKVRALITEEGRNHNSASETRKVRKKQRNRLTGAPRRRGMTDRLRGSNRRFSHFAVSNDEVLDHLILCTFVDDISLLLSLKFTTFMGVVEIC